MWWNLAKFVGKAYLLFWMVAVGGLVGANLAGLLAMVFVVPENKAVYVQPWVHGGWWVGTGLAFVGAITGKLRMISGGSKVTAIESSQIAGESQPQGSSISEPIKLSSLPSAILSIGFFGGLFGFLFGASLLVFWFSLNYSPFALAEWANSIEISEESMSPGRIATPTKTSSHPVAIYLVAIPTVVGGLGGAIAGAIGAALGKVRDG